MRDYVQDSEGLIIGSPESRFYSQHREETSLVFTTSPADALGEHFVHPKPGRL